jgi:hypothetical protein
MFALCAVEAVTGIALMAIALMRFGGFRRITRGNFGLGSVLFFVGLMLLPAAAITGYIASDRAENRRQLDQSLVKMWGSHLIRLRVYPRRAMRPAEHLA